MYCNAIHANTCTMYWHVLWHVLWYVLVVCIEYISACIQYLQVCIQYIPVCIGMFCVGIAYILNCNACKYLFNTYYNTYHNTCQIHNTRIGIRAKKYQHVLACIMMVLYEIMIRANNDQIRAVFSISANTDANIFTNTSLIKSNTDLYKIKYRPIQAPQTNAHIIVFNTCFFICQYRHCYCQIRRPRPHCSTVFYRCATGICLQVCHRHLSFPSSTLPHASWSLAYSSSVMLDSRTFHTTANFSSANSEECRFILVTRITVNAHSSESLD